MRFCRSAATRASRWRWRCRRSACWRGRASSDDKTYGYLIMAIKPDLMLPLADFRRDMSAMLARVKATPRQPGVDEIRLPGERAARERARLSREGIEIDRKIYDALRGAAAGHAAAAGKGVIRAGNGKGQPLHRRSPPRTMKPGSVLSCRLHRSHCAPRGLARSPRLVSGKSTPGAGGGAILSTGSVMRDTRCVGQAVALTLRLPARPC